MIRKREKRTQPLQQENSLFEWLFFTEVDEKTKNDLTKFIAATPAVQQRMKEFGPVVSERDLYNTRCIFGEAIHWHEKAETYSEGKEQESPPDLEKIASMKEFDNEIEVRLVSSGINILLSEYGKITDYTTPGEAMELNSMLQTVLYTIEDIQKRGT